jgi:hypothetical protein
MSALLALDDELASTQRAVHSVLETGAVRVCFSVVSGRLKCYSRQPSHLILLLFRSSPCAVAPVQGAAQSTLVLLEAVKASMGPLEAVRGEVKQLQVRWWDRALGAACALPLYCSLACA